MATTICVMCHRAKTRSKTRACVVCARELVRRHCARLLAARARRSKARADFRRRISKAFAAIRKYPEIQGAIDAGYIIFREDYFARTCTEGMTTFAEQAKEQPSWLLCCQFLGTAEQIDKVRNYAKRALASAKGS